MTGVETCCYGWTKDILECYYKEILKEMIMYKLLARISYSATSSAKRYSTTGRRSKNVKVGTGPLVRFWTKNRFFVSFLKD